MSEADDEAFMYIDPAADVQNVKETLRDMAVGIAVCAVVLAAIGCLFAGTEWYRWPLGVFLGAMTAGLMLWHLYLSLDRALDMDSDSANKYMKKRTMLRMFMAGAALAAGAVFPEVFQVIGVFLGILCLKFSAYLQPLTHKAIQLLSKGR